MQTIETKMTKNGILGFELMFYLSIALILTILVTYAWLFICRGKKWVFKPPTERMLTLVKDQPFFFTSILAIDLASIAFFSQFLQTEPDILIPLRLISISIFLILLSFILSKWMTHKIFFYLSDVTANVAVLSMSLGHGIYVYIFFNDFLGTIIWLVLVLMIFSFFLADIIMFYRYFKELPKNNGN